MKIGIVTPTLNGDKYLKICIESVLKQSCENNCKCHHSVEHIFVDGGSNDNTIPIIKEYQAKHPDVIKLMQGKDKNHGEAWVKGMRSSTADLLGWLGADDIYCPTAICHAANYFESNKQVMIAFGDCNYIGADNHVTRILKFKEFTLKEAINDKISIPNSSTFFRRSLIDEIDPSIISETDSETEYWFKVVHQYKFYHMPKTLSYFRVLPVKRGRQGGFYVNAYQNYQLGRKYGAGIFAPCARRYYLAKILKPFNFVVDPIFRKLTGNI